MNTLAGRTMCPSRARAAASASRSPSELPPTADAILALDPAGCTGNAFLDDELLAQSGVTDLSGYAADGAELQLDLFVEDWGAFAPS